MNIGEEEEAIEVPVPAHPDEMPLAEPAPEAEPDRQREPEKVPA